MGKWHRDYNLIDSIKIPSVPVIQIFMTIYRYTNCQEESGGV